MENLDTSFKDYGVPAVEISQSGRAHGKLILLPASG